jgi:hypothetical protein
MIYIYDLETYPNFFLASFKCIITNNFYEFEISDRKNQLKELREFLYQKGLKLIGFNNINFDYPVLHNTILKNNDNWSSEQIFEEVKLIISNRYSSIWDNQTKIPQLDLYRIWHYDNKNKSTSLKWLEFAMRMPNVADLPYKPGSILDDNAKDITIDYCRNDLNATHEFFNKSKKHIEIRQFYTNLEDINLINASEIKMSKEIFGKYLAKEMKISKKDVTQLRTYRNTFPVTDILFNYVQFTDEVNIKTLETFKKYNWVDTSNMNEEQTKLHSISFSVPYKNVVREYAEGGLHSFGKPGIYSSDDEYMLVDIDFASYYPHLSFRNKLHPEHIPEKIFSEIYEGFYTERKNYDKKDPRNYVLKIILNGSYGLSKDKYAFLYDPKWQLAICINGQLILTLLTEKVFEKCKIPPQIIFENTDGAMYRIHRSDYDLLTEACKEVEEIVNIPLEIQVCEKIVAKDVNNYINVISPTNVKFKGCFEIDRDYHKNHSKRVVSLALANYFINNVNVEDTIINHLNNNTNYSFGDVYGIYDFCIGSKMKGDNILYQRKLEGFEFIDTELNKMNRYYVSNDGVELIKKLPPLDKNNLTDTDKYKIKFDSNQLNIFDFIEDEITIEPEDRETNIEASWKCQLFNTFEVKDDYDINYQYYIEECNKIINSLI